MARTKSEMAHRKVLEAALRLFAERGIDATSMDAIAEASGVSKATIYKHWRDKNTLCLEVLVHLHGLNLEPPRFDSGDLRADLIAQLNYQPAEHRRKMRERIMPHLIAYSARNPVFGRQWRERVLEQPRRQLREMIERGVKSGLLKESVDPDVALPLLLGPMLYQHIMLKHLGGRVPPDLATYVVDAFLAAYGTTGAHPRT
ncbi:TetR/AcrR family transcriptional regulator [Pseudacidobacterium ailaaui]|jgi:AcrR family transcriptional regulator|uniref:TetR/AcrR family transcriptional regulator n=1 Tax=Pseudacidobacterium ailaaui TaxID=1382359 RepID=UPI0005D1578D|nr:TetR/AcrR family transcriptional regulator [Pseudacidobacterium ailaaui]